MKKIMLQTLPHTGTHALMYIFSVLGGIEVVWHHWEVGLIKDIDIAKNMDWRDFVFVRTHRDSLETLESYKSRAKTPKDGEEYFNKCMEVFVQHRRSFPRPAVIEIDGSNASKTRMVIEIFQRCEVEPPKAVLDYMKSWKKIASQHDEEPPAKAIKHALHKGRVGIWHMK